MKTKVEFIKENIEKLYPKEAIKDLFLGKYNKTEEEFEDYWKEANNIKATKDLSYEEEESIEFGKPVPEVKEAEVKDITGTMFLKTLNKLPTQNDIDIIIEYIEQEREALKEKIVFMIKHKM